MRRLRSITAALTLCVISQIANADLNAPAIEVTGTATVSIVPDRITFEIGMEEFYRHDGRGDSALVRIADIEKDVRRVLNRSGIPDSLIVVEDIGNYRSSESASKFLMAKKLSATVSDFSLLEAISENIGRDGIRSFNIARIDNSEMDLYNRQGLKAALDAAREKAEFIADCEKQTLAGVWDIVENGPSYYESPSFSNVAFASGSGMENMRRIVRRYSVKVRYIIQQWPSSPQQ